MKFSRNPESGQLEIYTDEGVYLGVMSTMGDDIGERSAEDGGPGSGNYGHKGRPGKVGGSGPGGGKQYRGGRSDIGYYNSRKDWLNGLQGERQHEAVRKIANAKKDYEAKLSAKQKIEQLRNRGFLTHAEAEERIKEGKLEKVREGMTPEEYILTAGNRSDRQDMLSMMKEARTWDETKQRLVNENLSDDEKKIYQAIREADLEKVDVPTGARVMDVMTLLEAKAMGIIESEIDVPDDIQYIIGTKEAPAPPKPKIPQNSDENNAWLEGQPQEKQDYILGIVRGLGINPQAFGGDIAMNYAEKRMMMDVWNGNEKAIWECRRYLDAKDGMLGTNFFKQCQEAADPNSTSNIGNLGDKPSIVLSLFLESLADEQREDNPATYVSSHGDILESGFLHDKDVPKSAKAAYLQLKAIALGQETYAVRPDDVAKELHKYMNERKRIRQEEKEFGPKRKAFKQDREKRQKEYSNAKNATEVGDAMRKSGMFRNGAKTELKKVSLECAKEVATAYENVMDKYPFLIGQLNGIDEGETANSTTYASCNMTFGGKVALNAHDRYFGNLNGLLATYDEDVKSGYHPAGTNGTSVITHEIGHALDGYLSQRGVNGARLSSTDANAFSGILRRSVLKSLKMTKASVRTELSRYAEKNAYEWFAECFAEAMTSANPRPMAKEMMRQLDEILKKEGLISA